MEEDECFFFTQFEGTERGVLLKGWIIFLRAHYREKSATDRSFDVTLGDEEIFFSCKLFSFEHLIQPVVKFDTLL